MRQSSDLSAKSTTPITDVRTGDVAEASMAVSHDFFRHRLTPLRPGGDFSMHLQSARRGDVTVGRLQFKGTDVSLDFGEFGDNYHFSIPVRGYVEATLGRELTTATPEHGTVYSPHTRTVVNRWSDGSVQFGVKFERHILERQLENMVGRSVQGIRFAPNLSVVTPAGSSWFQLLSMIVRDLQSADSVFHDPHVSAQISHAVTAGFLLASDHNWSEELHRPQPPARPRTIRCAVDAIDEAPEQLYTVSELAALTGTTVRSLQLGFAEHVGLSPMAYLREVRLQRVREDLTAGRGGTVAEVAHRWGFRHLGRFAASYRQRYGETPSETLQHG